MSKARSTLYAAIGAGSTALEKARSLPQRLVARSPSLPHISELPRTLGSLPSSLPQTAQRFAQRSRTVARTAAGRTAKVYEDFAQRGEAVVRNVKRTAPTRRAGSQAAKAKIEAAATGTRTATEATLEAAASAVEKTPKTATEQAS